MNVHTRQSDDDKRQSPAEFTSQSNEEKRVDPGEAADNHETGRSGCHRHAGAGWAAHGQHME